MAHQKERGGDPIRVVARRTADEPVAAGIRRPNPRGTDADGKVRVLPVVLYSGDGPWNALGDVAEVGVTTTGDVCLPVTGNYLLLDANRRAGEDLPRDNLVAAVFELNASETLDEMRARLRSLPRGLRDDVSRALIDWMRMVFPKKFPQADAAEVVASLKREFPNVAKEDGTMMALAKRPLEWEEKYGREGFEKGLKQGLEQGEKRGIEQGRAQGLERGLEAERELLGWLDENRDGTGAR